LRDKFNAGGSTTVHADWEKGYDKQVFLNVGSAYHFNDDIKLQVNFYNILGWVDTTLNKRHVVDSNGDYRSEASAFVLSLKVAF
jgi:hypothetical protein